MCVFFIYWTLNFWISRSPDLQNLKTKSMSPNRSARSGLVGRKQLPTLFHAFFPWAGKYKHVVFVLLFSLVGQWALSPCATRSRLNLVEMSAEGASNNFSPHLAPLKAGLANYITSEGRTGYSTHKDTYSPNLGWIAVRAHTG